MKEFQKNNGRVRFTDSSKETRQQLNDIKKYRPLTPEEEAECAFRARVLNDKKSKDKLVLHNMRFVLSVSKDYMIPSISYTEVVSAGIEGLCCAAERFDERKGIRFITYSLSWVQKHILEFLDLRSHMIHLPDSHQKKIAKMKKAVKRLEHKFQRQPTDEEVADMMSMERETITELRKLNATTFSCDAPLCNEDNDSTTFVDMMQTDSAATDEMAQHNCDKKALEAEIRRSLKKQEAELFLAFVEERFADVHEALESLNISYSHLQKAIENIKVKLQKNKMLRQYYYSA